MPLQYYFFIMVDLFCSWCKGLPYSEEALFLLKDSGLIKGVELSNLDEQVDLIKKSGLKVSIHNPVRGFLDSLESQGIENLFNVTPIKEICSKSDLSFVSFHTGYSARINKENTAEKILQDSKKNISFLKKNIDKKIILENCSLNSMFFENGDEKALNYFTGKEFFLELFEDSELGFLLDISHLISQASTKLARKSIVSIEDNCLDLINAFPLRIKEMHLNSTKIVNGQGFIDSHNVINPETKEGALSLKFAKETCAVAKKLDVITLEMDTGLSPIEHVKTIIKQAEIVNEFIL
jgi:uncharacterized protein (UPF0276 family)